VSWQGPVNVPSARALSATVWRDRLIAVGGVRVRSGEGELDGTAQYAGGQQLVGKPPELGAEAAANELVPDADAPGGEPQRLDECGARLAHALRGIVDSEAVVFPDG